MPKHVVEFAGPSYFGGKNDELVLCAGKGKFFSPRLVSWADASLGCAAGDIHIWDQESGTLLRYIRAAQQSGDMTCIAWNHAAEDPFMFATGSHDGGVRIWTQPSEEQQFEEPDGPDEGEDPAAIVRSASPLEFDMERTDSPLTQAEFDAVDALRRQESMHADTPRRQESMSTSEASVSFGTARERMVAFAGDSDEG
jgi:WD40 repeat protein